MDDKEQEFLAKLRITFRLEAGEHLEALSSGLQEWESGVSAQRAEELVESLFREIHSLKGAARSVDLIDTEALCQPLESVFAALKRHELMISPELFDLFRQTLSVLTILTADFNASFGRENAPELTRRLEAAVSERKTPQTAPVVLQPQRPAEPARPNTVETVRVPTPKLFSVLWQAEELLQAKLSAQQRLTEWKALAEFEGLPKAWAVPFGQVLRAAQKDVRTLSRLVEDHLETAKQLLMLPVLSLTEGFPKLVRDLAQSQGKDVDLVILGGGREIDKALLEELKDPLVHLLRNAVNHGVESAEVRRSKSKPPKAMIRLEFHLREDRSWDVAVSDDGSGLDCEKIADRAVALGTITRETAEQMDENQKADLIFLSGVSTSPVTDLAGRGLGLAIVKEKAERMGGKVSVRSIPGQSTSFVLQFPLTLSTMRGVLVRVSGQTFLIPSSSVERVVRVFPSEIHTAGNRPVLSFQGQSLPLVNLAAVLGLKPFSVPGSVQIAVLAQADRCAAFQVDEILGEQLVLVKALELPLKRVRNIAGATILGSGKVVSVVNVSDLLDFSQKAPPVSSKAVPEGNTAKILMVDDSITSRTLFKTFLEAAGHRVTSAVDGADAWEKLKRDDFDLVVSDIDMPRMNGLELTARIRGDAQRKALPVILITSMDSSEDKERGLEVGANAYLVKSRFDQKNLLEAVRRFV